MVKEVYGAVAAMFTACTTHSKWPDVETVPRTRAEGVVAGRPRLPRRLPEEGGHDWQEAPFGCSSRRFRCRGCGSVTASIERGCRRRQYCPLAYLADRGVEASAVIFMDAVALAADMSH